MTESLGKSYPSFIARSICSLEDFINSDVSREPCVVYCQFTGSNEMVMELIKYSSRSVMELRLQSGLVYKRVGNEWVDACGQKVDELSNHRQHIQKKLPMIGSSSVDVL